MAVIAAGIITGVATLGAAGLSAYLSHSAQQDALKEARRAENLRIKFADEESQREESRFARSLGLKREDLDTTKKGQNFQMVQSILDNITNMHNFNSEKFGKLKASFGSRRRR